MCALVTTKCRAGVHRLDNIMTVPLYNWSKQSVWSTNLNISMNGPSKVKCTQTLLGLKPSCGLCGVRKGNLGFVLNMYMFLSYQQLLLVVQKTNTNNKKSSCLHNLSIDSQIINEIHHILKVFKNKWYFCYLRFFCFTC